MWRCPVCKKEVISTKTLKINKAPLVLVINLKRFKHGRKQSSYGSSYSSGYGYGYSSGGGVEKLSTLVDFPIDGLDFKPFLLDKGEDGETHIYDLFAVSNHYGGLGGGHYTAYAKNWKDNQWYGFDDSSVSKVGHPSKVITEAAYNLFYRRRDKVDLSNIDYNRIRQGAVQEDLA